jgi:putative hemolysin
MASPMRLLSTLTGPIVWLLSVSTDEIFKLLGSQPTTEPPVTEEEIKTLVQQGAQADVFEAAEQDLIESVIGLGDRSVRSLITPRTQIVWLDLSDSVESVGNKKVKVAIHVFRSAEAVWTML